VLVLLTVKLKLLPTCKFMICPHCSNDNPDGRKYCHNCAKPLSLDAVPPKPVIPSPQPRPSLSGKAVASLVFGVLGLFVPFGIAAIVLGHMSRKQILSSGGKLRGQSLAFVGLIFAYIQVLIGITLFIAVVGLLFQFNQELDKHPGDRAALLAVIWNRGALKQQPPAPVDPVQREKAARDVLDLIRTRQEDYFSTHPSEGYACWLKQIADLNSGSEFSVLMEKSHYRIDIQRCFAFPERGYVALATPREPQSTEPNFCLDSKGGFYRYPAEEAGAVLTRIVGVDPEFCPSNGERVEP
jgi:uncharacterized protein DUF4190